MFNLLYKIEFCSMKLVKYLIFYSPGLSVGFFGAMFDEKEIEKSDNR